MSDENIPSRLLVDDKTKYIKIGSTTVEVVSKFTGKISLTELLKNAVKRDVEMACNQYFNDLEIHG